MTDAHKSRVIEIPERRGIWLYSYDSIRTRTRWLWCASTIFGFIALLCGSGLTWAVASHWQQRSEGSFVALVFGAMLLCAGLIEFPAGLIYYVRKLGGEPVDLWQIETPTDPAVAVETKDQTNGPDRH